MLFFSTGPEGSINRVFITILWFQKYFDDTVHCHQKPAPTTGPRPQRHNKYLFYWMFPKLIEKLKLVEVHLMLTDQHFLDNFPGSFPSSLLLGVWLGPQQHFNCETWKSGLRVLNCISGVLNVNDGEFSCSCFLSKHRPEDSHGHILVAGRPETAPSPRTPVSCLVTEELLATSSPGLGCCLHCSTSMLTKQISGFRTHFTLLGFLLD